MLIVETSTFAMGRYLVVQRPRPDNPGWAVYLVFLGETLVGKSFSMPDIGCCQWLEHGRYTKVRSAKLRRYTFNPPSPGSTQRTGRNGEKPE